MTFPSLIEAADRAVQDHLGGTAITYQPLVGDPVVVTGMFDRNYRLVDEGNAGVEQVVPAAWLRLADLPTDPDVDDPVLTIDGQTYKVRERDTDRVGGSVRLFLLRTG